MAPRFTLLIDPVQKPPCGCDDGSRLSFTAGECAKCATIGSLPGIDQDTGGKTVYLHNGEFFLHEVDLEIPGRGFNWRFARSYRSGIIFNGPQGQNWEFNYNRRLFVMGGTVLRMDGFARADAYTFNGDGTFTSPTGFYTGLVMNRDGTFMEREPNGTKIFYSRPDRRGIAVMTRVVDRNGNTMQFIYNRQNQLIRVIDTLGRPIEYRYNDQGRLIEVRDFFGRSIRFEYDTNGDLVAVTSPVVTGTPTRNDFRQGKTTRYSYSSGFADEVLNHNLLTITAPNEVASRGQPRIRIEYDTNPRSPNVDRVLRQTIGGTNAPAEFVNGQIRFRRDVRVPAGGTISYQYRFLGMVSPNDFISPVSQTTVTDRNGNRTEYQFNQLGNIVRIREFTNRDVRPGDPEFFETRYEYNKDGELLRMIYPEGNIVEYVYDDRNADRFQQGNLLGQTSRADSKRGGDQAFIRISNTYEPIYNQVRTVTEARGNDPSYVPPNGGANSAERYTTVYIFDYQEGSNFAALARELGVSKAAVRDLLRQANIPMGLGDVNGDGRTDQIAGNVVKVIYPTVNLLPDSHMARIEGSTRQPIEETYTYNRFGQMTRRRDAEGNVTVYSYYPENDPDGDGRDLTPGVGSEPFGYLREEIRDAESSRERNSGTDPLPAQIRRRYFYDRVGNVIGELDGRGTLTRYVVNQLNQVVQIIRAAEVTEALRNPEEPNFGGCTDPALVECRAGMVAFRYLTNIFYDFNNNVVRREVENRDSNNRSLAGSFIEYTMAYDILDNEIEMTQEVSENPREILVTRYRYDRNENRVLEISPMAVGQVVRSGAASLLNQWRQDVGSFFGRLKRGLLMTVALALEGSRFQGLGAMPFLPTGYWLLATDYSSLMALPPALQVTGPQPSNVVSYVYDERDLLFTSTRGGLTDQFKSLAAHADIPERTQIPNSRDISTFARVYDLNRNLKQFIDGADNTGDGQPEVTTYLYDGFDRQVSVIDAVGNQSFTQYDPASNVVRVSNFGPVGGSSPRTNTAATFTQPLTLSSFRQPLLSQVEYKYDELSRMFERNDRLFDYRGQGVNYVRTPVHTDGPLGVPNDGIVVTRYEYDRKSRRTFLIEDDLSTFQTLYDGVDRVIVEIDPEENEVRYTYDDNNNVVKVVEVELTQRDDVAMGKVPDLRETFTTINVYDSLNRLIRTTDNIGQTSRYQYDSRDNLIVTSDAQHSQDVADLIPDPLGLFPAEVAQVGNLRYNAVDTKPERDRTRMNTDATDQRGLATASNPQPAIRNPQSVAPRSSAFNDISNHKDTKITKKTASDLAPFVSPWSKATDDRGPTTEVPHPIASRTTDHGLRTTDNRPIADYDYIGPGRVLERTYANGVRLTYLDDARQRQIGYDGLKRVVLHRHLRQDNSLVAGFAYDYDRANNKLFEIKQHDNNRREDYAYDSIYRLVRFHRQGEEPDTWQIDGVGNWVNRRSLPNQANNMNEYISFAGVPQLHDDNGNLIDDGTNRYQYDFANRLRKVIRKADNAVIAVYRYDAHNRRNERIVTNTTSFDDQVRYLYDRWQEIEERRVLTTHQYVYGMWVDEVLTLDKDVNNDGANDQSFFYHADGKTHVVALSNSAARRVEHVAYDAYGRPILLRSEVGNPFMFASRRFDAESQLYYFRNRHSVGGRFLQRDPSGAWKDTMNVGNPYTYTGNNPINFQDPLGKFSWRAEAKIEDWDEFFGGGNDILAKFRFEVGFDCDNGCMNTINVQPIAVGGTEQVPNWFQGHCSTATDIETVDADCGNGKRGIIVVFGGACTNGDIEGGFSNVTAGATLGGGRATLGVDIQVPTIKGGGYHGEFVGAVKICCCCMHGRRCGWTAQKHAGILTVSSEEIWIEGKYGTLLPCGDVASDVVFFDNVYGRGEFTVQY